MKMSFRYSLPALALCLATLVCQPETTYGAEGSARLRDELQSGQSAGTPLDGRAFEEGGARWEASKNILQGEAGVSISDRSSFAARVSIPQKGERYILSAVVCPVAIDEGATWIAIGIGDTSVNPVKATWNNGLFLLLSTEGKYELHYNPGTGDLIRIKGGRASSYWEQGNNTLRMEYNAAGRTVSVRINEAPVLSDVELPPEVDGFEPLFAGFSGYGQKSEANSISHFELSVQ